LDVKYLFGANANKIQKYVFNSNKFKEIVGASKIIERLSGGFDLFGNTNDKKYNAEIIQNTTGSFKAIFSDLESLNKFIIDFNKKLAINAPNLLVTQAVLQEEESEINNNFTSVLQKIDDELSTNRNFPDILDYSPMIAEIDAASGFSAVKSVKINGEAVNSEDILEGGDESADFEKCVKLRSFENSGDRSLRSFFGNINIAGIFDEEKDLTNLNFDNLDKIYFESEFDKIKNAKSLIAVVHSDGNGTGFLKKDIFSKNDKSGKNFDNKNDYKEFSDNLNKAVKESACYAIVKTFKALINESKRKLPFRIFTLSGEDFNFVCQPDYVFELLRNYMLKYEELTSKYLKKFLEKAGIQKMTTTAGISLSKSHFPFYMSFDMAESLCGKAKKITKENINGGKQYKVPGTLLFHSMQSSYFSDLDHIIEKERKSHDKSIDFLFGPYAISAGHSYGFTYPDIGLLIETAKYLKKEKGLRSAFREALSIINIEGEKLGLSFLKRAKEVNPKQMELPLDDIRKLNGTDYYKKSLNKDDGKEKAKKCAIYDLISIESSIDAKWSI
jgi:hypothetical protein